MLYRGLILTILNFLEKIVKLEERMEDIEANVNYVGRDMKDAFRAGMKESVQEIKKYINVVGETESISKRNGELYLICFYFVFNVFMN